MDLLMLHDVQSALERRNPRKATGASVRRKQRTNIDGTAQHHSGAGQIGSRHAWWSRARALQKTKGDRNETKSHRGILVQNLPGAMHATFLKRDIDEHYMKFIHETQYGCAKGRGTCMAGQIVEQAANFSKERGKCWGRLYKELDLSAAFDSILREFLIADSTYNVQLMQSALKALNISDDVCEPIVNEAITERNLIRRTGASAQLSDLVGDMHTATWIVCSNEMPDNDDMVVWTKRGSRQGCPLGGIAFNLMYEQVLRKIRTAGEKHGIWKEIMYHPAQPPWNVSSWVKAHVDEHTQHDTRNWITTTLADVTFVDDACFSFEADNPVSLVNSASTLLQIVDETCEAHGLLVNMNDGKTEFSNEMTGVGARKQFRRLSMERRQEGTLHFHEDG